MGTSARRAEATRRSIARLIGMGVDPPDRVSALRELVGRNSLNVLRLSLGLVFVWFGALKVTNSTPVAELVADTLPFLPNDQFIPALGLFEVILGIALMIGRRTGLVVLLMIAHLAGTFLVLVTQPDVAFLGGNPLVLTMTGEFVVKNLILISAGLVLATNRVDRKPEMENEESRSPQPVRTEAGVGDGGPTS